MVPTTPAGVPGSVRIPDWLTAYFIMHFHPHDTVARCSE